jgi:type II secretory pathway pseudopilin PulG
VRIRRSNKESVEMTNTRDRGESLIEVVLTIVIVSVAVTALVASLASASRSSTTQRRVQITDVVLRGYAEAAKLATASCTAGQSYSISFSPPNGYTADYSAFGADQSPDPSKKGVCPAVDTVQILELAVTQPEGITHTMKIAVRTP